jgi:hypothetical protein
MKSSTWQIPLSAIFIIAFAIPVTAGAQDSKPVMMDKVVVSDLKTHTLFMGADIAVNLGNELYPVRGVVGSSWVIEVNGKEKIVPTRDAPLDLKITPNLKLTDVSATIADYKKERAYTFDNDPNVRMTRGLTQAAQTNLLAQGIALDAQHLADSASNNALGGAALLAGSDRQFGSSAMSVTAATSPAVAHPPKATGAAVPFNPLAATGVPVGVALDNQLADAAVNQAESANELGERAARTGLDAMDVEFEISSAKPLQKPYVVTLTRFHPKNAKPGMVQNFVYAKELGPIDAHPAKVHFVEGGFPYDFELIDFQLHVYNRGEEVATTVSSKRVELTRNEAFEYIKMLYIGAHKDDTLPAAPAMGILPADLPKRLAEGAFKEPFFVKVSKDGVADEPFLDAACTKKVEDPYLESVVRSIRFKPALDKGKPVDGIAQIKLAQLAI